MSSSEVTRLLFELEQGDRSAIDRLLPLVYDELRNMAAGQLCRDRAGHTLQPTALVHEVYMKLVAGEDPGYRNRAHFMGIAARAMRQVLINHAVRRKAIKRGGERQRVPLDDILTAFEDRSGDLVALDEALNKLAEMDPQQARLVEMRFFGGLNMADVAPVLGMSLRTAEREWAMARAWLRRELQAEDAPSRTW